MMAYLTRPPRSEQQEASGERVQLAAGGLLKVLKKVFPKRDLSEYADLIEQARKAGVPINTIKDLENFQKQVQEASGKIYESRKKYPGVEGEKSGLPIDENELSTEQLIEYRKDNRAGKGRFTNAEAIIARLENTIKGMDPDDEDYEYVTKTFPNFIKELKANPKLAENENVWNNLMSELPEDQRFIKYDDGTVDFETKKPSHQFKLREDLDTDRLGIKTDRTLNAEGGRIGAPRKPITDREERIAQALYGKSFDEIESKDIRSKIRRGLYTEQSKAQGTNIERSEKAKTRAKEFVKKFKKENKRLPSLKELTTQGKLDYYVAKKYVDQGVVDVLPKNTTKGLGTKAPVDEQLLILNKNKKIKNAIKKGEIPSLQEVADILNVDKSTAANRIGQLADTYSGLRSVEGIKDKSNKASLINEKLKRKQYEIRKTYESQVQKSIGEPKSISSQRKQIQRSLGDVSDYAVDEPGGLTSSARLGSEPYGSFSQIIKGDVNNKLKSEFDAKKAKKEKNLQRAIESNDKKAIKAAEIDFNNLISEYENKLNKNRIGKDKIKLFKVKVDLDNPEKLAQKTIKNFDKLPENYKNSFIENAVKNKYAFEVPSDIKTTYQIRKDLENPKIRNKVLKKAGSGNLRLYSGFSPELGKLSYEVLKDVAKGIPTPLGAVGLTAATGGIDPTSAIDRTALGAELAFAPELVRQSAKFGPTAQRILNLGLSPKMAMRAARFASPVGIASLGAEGAYQLYQALENEKARIAAMSPEERQRFEEEQTAAAYMGEAEGLD